MEFEKTKTLLDGNKIPVLGFGTDLIPEGEIAINAVENAIKCGYRHIDNADIYKNQKSVGIAIKNCIKQGIIRREELFITSKVPDSKQGYESTIECCKNSLYEMGLEYFDLYLIHSPLRGRQDWREKIIKTYEALELLQSKGLIKSIGVSNFTKIHLFHLYDNAKTRPVVNQIEIHPQHQQKETVDWCRKFYIQPVAWGTLNQGRIFRNQIFLEMAKKYNVTPSQIAIRWSIQKGNVCLVRSIKEEHIKNNFNIENFEISQEDMKILDSLDGGEFSDMHHDNVASLHTCSNANPITTKDIFTSYEKKFKLFSFLTLFKILKESKRITKLYLFGICVLKIDTKGN